MKRPFSSLLLIALLLLAFGSATAAEQSSAPPKPNIVLIVADDLGYGELGCYGGKDVPTPRIDSIAKNGVRCTDGYVSCPVCSPTRAGLMTGKYQQRFGHEFNPGPVQQASPEFGLPLSEKTMADHLKAAGYATGMVGKWHLGYQPQFHPLKRGFGEFFGFLGGAHGYFSGRQQPGNEIMRGDQAAAEEQYLTRAFAREAVAFIDRHQKEPFFLYLPFNAVHGPLQAPPRYLERFKNLDANKRRTFAAMLSALDDGVGAVLDKLAQSGLDKNTIVVFISDNGGPTRQTTSSNTPLSGFKGQVYEGGVRVPFMVQWPGKIPAGKEYNQPVIALDLLPTVLAAVGAPIPEGLDGVNLLPYLRGEKAGAPHEALYWRFGPQSAVRQGDWKLVNMPKTPVQLFNLKEDIAERNNLADKEPEKREQLSAALARWDGKLAAPRWRPQGQASGAPAGR